MAGSFPTLSGGTTAMYPLSIKVTCLTRVQRGAHSSEQRWVVCAPFADLEATYTNLSADDQSTVQAFHDSQKGAYDSTWSFTLDSRTFTACRFYDDELKWEEKIPNRWTTVLRFGGFYPSISSPPSEFPSLTSGAITQRPWTKRRDYETSFSDTETRIRHATALRGGGLTNFPTDPLRTWDIQCPVISPSDADKHVKFFISNHGRYGSFSFTDPDTLVAYTGCRYASDELTVRYDGYNRCSLSVSIVKT